MHKVLYKDIIESEILLHLSTVKQGFETLEMYYYSLIIDSIFANMQDTHIIAFDTEITVLTELCRQDPELTCSSEYNWDGGDRYKQICYLLSEPD